MGITSRWRADLRRLLLTDDLLALPEQMTSLRAHTERGFQDLAAAQRRTEERMARREELVAQLAEAQRQAVTQMTQLAEAQRQTEEQMAECTGQMAKSKRIAQTLSTDWNSAIATMPLAYVSRLVRRAHALSTEELASLATRQEQEQNARLHRLCLLSFIHVL